MVSLYVLSAQIRQIEHTAWQRAKKGDGAYVLHLREQSDRLEQSGWDYCAEKWDLFVALKRNHAGPEFAPLPGSPSDFGKLIAEETGKWAKVVRFAGLRSD